MEDLSSRRAGFCFRICVNSPFPSCLKPLFQSEAKCEAIDTKMSFDSHAGKLTYFHNKDFAICLVLKERVFGLN